jgi:hypothetical protein
MGHDGLAARLGYPADEALRLLLHHVHGGLHNAAMSLELAGEDGEGGRVSADDARLVAQSGLEGIARAARGISLLTVMLGLSHGTGDPPATSDWIELVEALLRRRAIDRQADLTIELDRASPDGSQLDAATLVATLLDGIASIDRAPPGARLRLPRTAPVAAH